MHLNNYLSVVQQKVTRSLHIALNEQFAMYIVNVVRQTENFADTFAMLNNLCFVIHCFCSVNKGDFSFILFVTIVIYCLLWVFFFEKYS